MSIPLAARITGAMVLVSLVHVLAFAQPRPAGLDSVRIAYDFSPGESVAYRVVTYDTLEMQPPSTADTPSPPMATRRVAERAQFVTFTCVGEVEEGYLMEMKGKGYASREVRDSLPEVVRTSHPWAERTLRFSMARDGRRVILYSASDTGGVAPSGPFQPLLLPLLGDSGAWVGATQFFKRKHWLLDNAIPPSAWDGSILRVVGTRRDTLGLSTLEIQLDEIAASSHEPPAEAGPLRYTTIASVSGAGTHYFSPMLGFPVAGTMRSVLKLDIASPEGRHMDGRQTLVVTYEMVAIEPAEVR